jgi:hypothetical protein
MRKILSLALLAGFMATSAVHAATLSIDGSKGLLQNASRNDVLSSFGVAAPTTGYNGSTVRLSGASRVRVSFVGFESAYDNKFSLGGKSFKNSDFGTRRAVMGRDRAPSFVVDVSDGLLSFSFASLTSGAVVANGKNKFGGKTPYANFFATFGGTDSQTGDVLTLFFDDDGASKDSDYDDLVIQIALIENPLPASGILLIGGIGGMGLLRLRKQRRQAKQK